MITLITGGSGSGKSAYAEKYICHASNEKGCKEKYYIATMHVFDDEGQRKIDRHRRLRAGKGFITIEQPRDIKKAVEKLQSENCLKTGRSALLECMSNLVANEMFPPVDVSGMQAAEAKKETLDDPENMKDYDTAQISRVSKKVLKEVSILSENVAELVIVTNNVFEDGVSYDQSTMNYIKAMGIVNRGLAAMAESVVEVVAGIPVTVK
ncbi:bifunctional adenosylcobinamide kinase/adenosylcobinamide-phosphate guanylyltransferase [Agathobacter rectalis]|jgi:adenosylcobinamide kinase/adenosylcobinamide-phosphate guanylyltransferase|uniref:Adenosylcobinamide kinase n=1 Tax=Agathobacter rectalis TaxID=39491 RepID=A0A413DKG0_9FIRM|nr:bifunctional adenosylcobinamide kinase/adenosylcobinamide-phosphate guanylyltransferase [Agathobacter rectalis]RGW86571.1 cobinamide kinase [Agathobacter rectalis]